jgi:YidC/Oxa1 family membrane protein insertase
MSFQQRLFLTVLLCLGIYMLFDLMFPPPPPADGSADTQGSMESGTTGGVAEGETTDGGTRATGDLGQAVGPTPTPEAPAPTPASAVAEIELVEHRLQNALVAIDVTNSGWGLVRHTELLGEQFQEDDGHGLDLLLLGEDPSLELAFDPEQTNFALPAGTRGEVVEATQRRFTVRQRAAEIEVLQTLELLDGYELTYDVSLINHGSATAQYALRLRNRLGQAAESSRYDIHRALCRTAEDLEEYEADDVEEGPQRVPTGVRWIGVTSQYFAHLVVPTEGEYGCEAAQSSDGQFLLASLLGNSQRLEPRESSQHRFAMYMGAKNQDRLENFSLAPDAGLEYAIDWGWFGGLSRVLGGLLFDLLRWIHSLVGVWGVSIIILTAIVKLTTLPLTLKQMRSMKAMGKLKPEIEKIQKKHKDDRQRQQVEIMNLYKAHKVNPLAGCLPMLLQMPIWFALYKMLMAAAELYNAPFLWLPDLTKPDPFFVLPLAMGAQMFVQTRIQPMAADNQQAKMMQWMMPIIFTVMMLFLPSGLGIYIFANSSFPSSRPSSSCVRTRSPPRPRRSRYPERPLE